MVVATLFLAVSSASARWADPSEADAAVNLYSVRAMVKKDGTYTLDVEVQQEILKEGARLRLGLSRINYDAKASSFDLKEAYTLNGDTKIKVKPQMVEIKPMASMGPGFDEINQVTIAFPDVAVGSKLYYRYHREVKKPQIPGMFWQHFPLGWSELLQKFELSVESEVPIYFEAFDPQKQLEVKTFEKRVTATLKSPIFRAVVEEENIKMDAKSLIWIGVSTLKNWSDLPKYLLEKYESTVTSSLPAKYQEIVEAAKKEKSPVDQINTVTSKLADAVRYVGDWAPVEGAFFPRPLATVVETGFGDCKDYSSSTVAMLRHLGFESWVTWVMRERNLVETPLRIATPAFNHAMVYARKDGKDYWIDPTNVSSFAQGLYEDIAGRRTLVLNPKKVEMKQIPASSDKDASTSVTGTVHFGSGRRALAKGHILLRGGDTVTMTASGLSHAKSILDYAFLNWLANTSSVTDWKFSDYDLKTRVVKDLKVEFEFRENWLAVPTSVGRGYMTKSLPHIGAFQFQPEKRVSDLYLGYPRTLDRKWEFDGSLVKMNGQTRCTGTSPWLDFSREFRRQKARVVLEERVVLKKASVPVAEIKSKAFADLQASLRSCHHSAVLVLGK